MVSTSRLERTGGRRASSNGLEESQALPRWQSCKENLFVLLPRQRLWMGGEGGERGKLARGRGKERKIGQKRESENKWMMWEEGEGMMSCCAEIWARASLFTPSLPCLCWMILNCVGEFTVFCNLIPNKVTQQILLSRLDAAAFWAAQTGHNKKMFPLQTVFLQAGYWALLEQPHSFFLHLHLFLTVAPVASSFLSFSSTSSPSLPLFFSPLELTMWSPTFFSF